MTPDKRLSPRPGRAGDYVRQPGGFKAFLPAPLPPAPPLRIEGNLQQGLSRADHALGRLDGSIQALPDPDLFVFMYVRKEAVLSSQIEGTQSSLQDLLNAEAEIMDPDRPVDVREVINHVNALNYGLERLSTLPVSVRLMREIHEKLLDGVRGSHLTPGELRHSQNWIGPAGGGISDAVFVPPPPEDVPNALGRLESFLHAPSDIPLLLAIGLAHAQFETIHPFLDGNGRLGRLLVTFLLCEKEVLRKPVLYLSHFFRSNRQEYYDRLQAIRDEGAWEEWLCFFVRGVSEVSLEAFETIRKIVELRESHRRVITESLGRVSGNGLRVLESLYTHPVISVEAVRKITGTTYPASNNLVSKLVERGILIETTGRRRHRRYRYDAYVELFS